MMHDRCKFFFSSWAIFCTFTPLTAQKIKIKKEKNEKNKKQKKTKTKQKKNKKKKKHQEISFYTCVPMIR